MSVWDGLVDESAQLAFVSQGQVVEQRQVVRSCRRCNPCALVNKLIPRGHAVS